SRSRDAGRVLDDPKHAGSGRTLLLPDVSDLPGEGSDAPLGTGHDVQGPDHAARTAFRITFLMGTGLLILNADDWGRDSKTTNMILDCVVRGSVSSTSAMVFMEDSERAAALARQHRVDCGLHLNFTTPFDGSA